MWSNFTESRILSHTGWAMNLECPTKDLQGKSCWLHTRESGPEVVQGQVEWLHLRHSLVPSCCGTITDCIWPSPPRTAVFFESAWDCCPRDSSPRKSGYENNWMNEKFEKGIFRVCKSTRSRCDTADTVAYDFLMLPIKFPAGDSTSMVQEQPSEFAHQLQPERHLKGRFVRITS